MRLRFGSVCSGIEAASVAWNPLGWEAAWLSEIEPFPCAVLAHHFPTIPNLGDMTTLPERIRAGEAEAPEILCGGTPCVAFSVAGKRKSLDDERGLLSLTFCNVADSIDAVRRERGLSPCIVFWENVPGVLNTKDNAFGCLLGELVGADAPLSTPSGRWPSAGLVAGPKRKAAWRVLDAQYFGVPQRRRRVFLVGRGAEEGLAFDPAKVLFEPKGLPRADEASERPREDLAAYAEGSFGAYREVSAAGPVRTAGGTYGGGSENLLLCYDMTHANDVIRSAPTAPTLLSRMGTGGNQIPLVISHPQGAAMRVYDDGKTGELTSTDSSAPIVLAENTIGRKPENGGNGIGWDDKGVMYTLNATGVHGIVSEAVVRRLTPIECERLQGFPDDWTRIPWKGKPAEACPDTPRYRAIGNSWAVPCVRWIGKRIEEELNRNNSAKTL